MGYSYPSSDHKFVTSVFNYKTWKCKSQQIETRCLNLSNLDKIKAKISDHFSHLDLSLLINPNTYWTEVSNVIKYCRDNIAKLKKKNVELINKTPWHSVDLHRIARKRDKSHHAAFNNPGDKVK